MNTYINKYNLIVMKLAFVHHGFYNLIRIN